ncbi:Serine/threonine-protein phosphatase 6 regulatory ankyrin repeat subunit A [Hondaea fermentalgiana]|uniref:Serine/threonine-protein phosphatase 6 regulatory ankyrin repeat subunit A n=1 Tax=Hondaea fermentalgiana TaxID=2315210 RepID=A0A2R5GHJ7_9STRA|nr:Serine/threonine-protein phosphatase 6 regulatory ankyrin repeat subunit A [Hondaea fermentalgiana]|eukprot:GBG27761.1 Serine/threonine-protein phosphatase 6 regulatory ankyrin repeat subunit A [Hondaea fermentalgiana]
MDGGEYLARYEKVTTFEEREALVAEAQALENEDRKAFALEDKSAPEAAALAAKPYKGLVAVFESEDNGGQAAFKQRMTFSQDKGKGATPRLFSRTDEERKALWSKPATVEKLSVFQQQFLQIFACNGLQFMNWDNIVAAGGAISACVQPIPEEHSDSLLQKRSYYHEVAYGASDVDLFLYDLTPEQANRKLLDIYDALCAACPFEVICFRSANAVTMVSQYPYRHVQVVLRIYSSPYEVLAGFDVDCCTFLYDGQQVYTTARGHAALMLGANTIDMSRRSPSYEMRLAKYGSRGFEVIVPGFSRKRIDPNLFDKPWNLLVGLQRLIVLDRLRSAEARLRYQTRHQVQSGMAMRRDLSYRKYDQLERIEKAGAADESSNYATVFLPWGPGYDARKVLKLMKRKDIAFNSPYYRRDRTYYLHPCFFGTAAEILDDCSPSDPDLPEDVPASELRSYVRGELTWMQTDPGQQQIGSFNPITNTEWSRGAYFEETTSDVVAAVNRNDVAELTQVLEDLGQTWDPHRRDYLGRSPLHVGIMSGAEEACELLLDMGVVDPTLRLPDGRSALHLAAEYNRVAIVRAILPAIRRMEEARAAYEAKSQTEKDQLQADGVIPPRDITVEDALNVKTFNTKLTPLEIAVIIGHVEVARVLLEDYGATADSLVSPPESSVFYYPLRPKLGLVYSEEPAVPLILMTPPGEVLSPLVELLLDHGAAGPSLFISSFLSVMHLAAEFGHIELIRAMISGLDKRDPQLLEKMLGMVDFQLRTPLMTAVANGHLECAKALYARVPKFVVTSEELALARIAASKVSADFPRYYGRSTPLSDASVEVVDNCLAIACAGLLEATNDMLDPRSKGLILGSENNNTSYFNRRNAYSQSYVDYSDYLAARDGIFAPSKRTGDDDDDDEDDDDEAGDNDENNPRVQQARKRVDRAAATLYWVLTEGASEKLWEQEYDYASRFFLGFSLVDGHDSRYGGGWGAKVNKEAADDEAPKRGTIVDMLQIARSKLVKAAEKLHESANIVAFEKALEKVATKYPDPSTYKGFLVDLEVKAHKLNATIQTLNLRTVPDEVKMAKIQAFVARLDLLVATLTAASQGNNEGAPPAASSSGRLSARRSMRGFLRGLGTSKRSSVPRLVAGLTSGGASAEGAASAARSGAASSGSFAPPASAPKKLISVEEYITKIETKLFRTFSIQQKYTVYWGSFFKINNVYHDRTSYNSSSNALLSESQADFVMATFEAIFANDIEAVLASLQNPGLQFPLLLVRDAKANTFLGYVSAFMEDPAPIVAEALAILDRSWKSSSDKKEAGQEAPKRAAKKGARVIDNTKLLAMMAEAESDTSGSDLEEDDLDDDEDEDGTDEDDDEADLDDGDDELVFDNDLDRDTGRVKAMAKRKVLVTVLTEDGDAIFVPKCQVYGCSVILGHDMVMKHVPPHARAAMLEAEEARVRMGTNGAMVSYTMDLLRVAILRGKYDLLDILLRYARGIASEESQYLRNQGLEWCSGVKIAQFVIAFDSVEALKVLTRVAGGGIASYMDLARNLGLEKSFKVPKDNRDDDSMRYQGMTTVLESTKGAQRYAFSSYATRRSSRENVNLDSTWIGEAAYWGSLNVYQWLRDDFDEVAATFGEFLQSNAKSASAQGRPDAIARMIARFAEAAMEQLYEGKLWHLNAEPRLADRVDSPAQMLAALIARTCIDVPVQCGPTGASVIYYAVHGVQIEFIENVIDGESALLDEPCCIIEARKKPKSKGDKASKPEDKDFVRGPNGSEVIYSAPLIQAALTGSIAMFRRLLELGANPHVKSGYSGDNALQLLFDKRPQGKPIDSRLATSAINIVAEVCGQKELLRMLSHRNKAGVSAFHTLFAEGTSKLLEHIFETVVSRDWVEAVQIRDEIVKDNIWSAASRDKIALLIRYVESGDLFQEFDDGLTVMDHFAAKQINLSAALVRGDPDRELAVDGAQRSRIKEALTKYKTARSYYGYYWGAGMSAAMHYLLPDLTTHPLMPTYERLLRKHKARRLVDFPTAQAAVLKKIDQLASSSEMSRSSATGAEASDQEDGISLWKGNPMFDSSPEEAVLHKLLGQSETPRSVTVDDSKDNSYNYGYYW